VIECGTCRCARRTTSGEVILGKGRHLAFDEVFFTAHGLVGEQPLGHQKGIGSNTQARMVVESSPTASLIVPQSEILLEILVVTLNAPSLVGATDQLVQRSALG